jgi:hypothetical protein
LPEQSSCISHSIDVFVNVNSRDSGSKKDGACEFFGADGVSANFLGMKNLARDDGLRISAQLVTQRSADCRLDGQLAGVDYRGAKAETKT